MNILGPLRPFWSNFWGKLGGLVGNAPRTVCGLGQGKAGTINAATRGAQLLSSRRADAGYHPGRALSPGAVLHCPKCGVRKMRVLFEPPSMPNL